MHFARFALSYPPNTSVFLPRPLTPLHFPVLARSLPSPRLRQSSRQNGQKRNLLISGNRCAEIPEFFESKDSGTTQCRPVVTRYRSTLPGRLSPPSVGARQKGDSKWEKPVSAKICGFLRLPAKICGSCGFLRKSATPKSLDLQSELKISENLRKCWADPGVVWKKAPRAVRAMRGKAPPNRTF